MGRSTAVLVATLALLAGCTSTDGQPVASGSAQSTAPTAAGTAALSPTPSATATRTPPGHTVLGLVLSSRRLAEGYRVTMAPARRDADGQYLAIPGRRPLTYLVPSRLVLDGGISLVGVIEVTSRGKQVTALIIEGG
ncbi:MAG: hypothetical protein JWR52_454 [Marmoricola sp.]|nr:hypothetical protein [Marmoricola sp.]